MNIDTYLFESIHHYAGKYKILDSIAIWCAEYLGYVILAFIGLGALVLGRWQIFIWPLAAGLIARFAINEAIYAVYQRKRPAEFFGFQPLVKKPRHPSFPSGHAAFFLGIACALLAYSIPLGIICIIIGLIVGLARVFCGVHWPLDIIAGLGAGMIASIIMWKII